MNVFYIENRKDKLGAHPSDIAIIRDCAKENKWRLRAPHYTCSRDGILAELALAGGGILLFDETEKFDLEAIRKVILTTYMMWPEHRPTLVFLAYEAMPGKVKEWLGAYPEISYTEISR